MQLRCSTVEVVLVDRQDDFAVGAHTADGKIKGVKAVQAAFDHL